MNKKGESVRFVVITTAALIIIGLMFITFGRESTITSKTTYTKTACYTVHYGELTTTDVAKCCLAIKKSNGCEPYNSREIKDSLYICSNVVVNKETIDYCS